MGEVRGFTYFKMLGSNRQTQGKRVKLNEVSVEPSGVQCFEESKSFEG